MSSSFSSSCSVKEPKYDDKSLAIYLKNSLNSTKTCLNFQWSLSNPNEKFLVYQTKTSLALCTRFQKHCSIQHLLNQQQLEFLNEYIFLNFFFVFN